MFCLGSGPVLCVVFVVCRLLRCFRWRNASLAGGFAGRRVWLAAVFFCVLFQSICRLNGLYMSLYKCLSSLFSCKDRAFSATSATLEEKKPKGHWRTPMPHCSKQNSLQAQSTSKIAEPYAACCCLKSLRIRVEARANVTEREVISRQLQLMQASVQHYPTEDLNTADTSCLSRISAGLCSEKNARISVSM